ncbi:MAG: VanZ family protein, partial [Acidobacteria bacterium]
LLVVHAVVSEPLQHLVAPVRQLDPWDAVADLVGVGAGWLLAGRFLRASRERSG